MTVTSAVLEQSPDDGLSDGALRRLQRLAAVLAIGAVLETLVILATVATVLLLLFPTDRLISQPWRLVAVLGIVGALLYEIGIVFHPGEIDPDNLPGIANPLGAPDAFGGLLDASEALGNALVTV